MSNIQEAIATENEVNTTTVDRAGKYLTFKLGGEEYGLEILKVREIIGLMDITEVPKIPDHFRGIINLRGQVIPVMELRKKFGMKTTKDTEQTCVIVVEVSNNKKSVSTGLLVDSVSEVLEITGDQIENAPSFGTDVDTDYILGIGKIGDMVKILLDIDKVLDDDKSVIDGMAKK
ncbi:MAG: purine-binding chemotaxis protein CheW [candidate division Zixibacteria bacterium]|nr:purine-binding chemotaxis protein CheW [candidate division Zixibacteria bacterium]